MIGKKDLKGLGKDTIEEYYSYIVESKENGVFSQVKTLIKALSVRQYNSFLIYLQDEEIKLEDCFLRK